ncbi:MAG: precorrin-8X methylmutase [Epsilonproteobacteria bacterium]|nr:precorrin-8X methylmutase [Campylobacterota bacterium]
MNFTLEEPPINIGADISEKSFEMIEAEIINYPKYHQFDKNEQALIERLIHTTTCFEQVIENIYFSKNAMMKLKDLLQKGAKIVVDTNMIRSGVSEFYLKKYGNEVICYVNEPEVFTMAEQNGTTRSYAAVELAIQKFKNEPMVLACGNAPTFIYAAINTLIKEQVDLDNVILLLFPVGFVNVVESKEYGRKFLEHFDAQGIILQGRYGASTMVVASLHAAYKLIKDFDTGQGRYNGK